MDGTGQAACFREVKNQISKRSNHEQTPSCNYQSIKSSGSHQITPEVLA